MVAATVGAAEAEVESRRGIGDERIGRSPEARDDRVAGSIGEVDVEAAARGVGRKGEAEQAALAAGEIAPAQIEEVRRQHRAAAHDADAAGLLDDELHGAIERILDERDRRA